MKLIVQGMRHGERTQFKHLWGRYILGFKPAYHCARSLKSRVATAIKPFMTDGEYELDPAYELFYLCGVGWAERRHTNVHLAVTPRSGSMASIDSAYGSRFTITDAEAIPIQPLPDGWQGLPEKHWRCKNFQFGCQMFAPGRVGAAAEGDLITTLKDGRALRRTS